MNTTDIDIRVPAHMRDSNSLVIRNDEGACEIDLTLDEAIAATRSRYSPEDEVWIDVADEDEQDEDEDEQDPDTTWAGVCNGDDEP